MKQLNTIFAASLLLFVVLQSKAQTHSEKPWQVSKAYLSANGGSNNALAFTLHFNNRWAGMITKETGKLEAKNMPKDYKAGTTTILFIPIEGSKPNDSYETYSLSMGRVLTKHSDKAWVMATGGLSVCNYTTNEFTRNKTVTDYNDPILMFFGFGGTESNYSTKEVKKTGFGASIGLQANLNLFRFMGLGGGANLQVNTAAVIPSAWLGINVGLMRPAKSKPVLQQ
jgi:hypothetical protein